MDNTVDKLKSEVKLMSDAMQDVIDRISAMESKATKTKHVDLTEKPKKEAKKDVDSSKDKKQD